MMPNIKICINDSTAVVVSGHTMYDDVCIVWHALALSSPARALENAIRQGFHERGRGRLAPSTVVEEVNQTVYVAWNKSLEARRGLKIALLRRHSSALYVLRVRLYLCDGF